MELGDRRVGVADVVKVARQSQQVRLASAVAARLSRARAVVETFAAGDRAVYGLNTGLGAAVDTPLSRADIASFQHRAVMARAVGVGDFLSTEEVRATLFVRLCGIARGASGLSPQFAEVIALMLERGILSQQLERNNRELKRRRDAAIAAAEKYFPPGTCWNVPHGGLYIWVKLPKTGPTAAELYISAIQMGVAYAIGNVFYTNGCGTYHMRVNYGSHKPADIEEGFRRLGRAWRELACDYAELEKSPLL